MPIFEYTCRACKNQFELLVLHNATPTCPSCAGVDLEKQLSAFAVNSPEMSRNRVKKARKAMASSKDFIDKRVAEAEHERDHHH